MKEQLLAKGDIYVIYIIKGDGQSDVSILSCIIWNLQHM